MKKERFVDVVKTTEGLIKKTDWRIQENANIPFSFSNVFFRVSGDVISKYMLSRVYPSKVAKAHVNGDLHIHNLYLGLNGYCCGWDLKLLLMQGLGKLPGRVATNPPKHFNTALHHIVNFVGMIQGEWSGAQAFNSFDTLLAPFVRKDNLNYKQIKQALQEFVFGLNVTARWGSQSPFTNITLDWKVPEDFANEKILIGGKLLEDTYSEYQEEMDLINKAFIEIMLEGDAIGRVFTFPIPTYNITKDFDWDSENASLLFEMTAKYGIPYFSNFISSDLKPSDIRSMCLHPEEEIIIKNEDKIHRDAIGKVVEKYSSTPEKDGWSRPKKELEVLSLNPKTLKTEWAKVKRFLRLKTNTYIKITTEDGKSIKVSPNHIVCVATPNGLVQKFAKEVKKGDILLTLKHAKENLKNNYQKIGNFILNEKLASLLGFFTADGNYLFENRKNLKTYGLPKGLQFTFDARNFSLIQEIKKLIEEVFRHETKEKKDPRYNTYYLYLYSANIARLIYNAGFRKYGRLPEVLFNSPSTVIESFLTSFFVGDGYEKCKEIHINDRDLARDIVILSSLIGKAICYKERANSQRIYFQHKKSEINSIGNLATPALHERMPGLFAQSTFKVPGLTKKRMVGIKTLDKYDAHTEESKRFLNGNVAFVRVKIVEKIPLQNKQVFYDVELEKNHLFVHSLGTITHNCCRLRLDLRQLQKNITGGLFGSANLTGSIGVVTINMPRLGYTSKNENQFFEKLEELMEIASLSLEIKRKMLNQNMKNGLLPYTQAYLGTFENHFSTIGLIGMNEACLNLLGVDIADPEGKRLAIETLKFMRKKVLEFQQKTGNLYNLEATPAEGLSFRFALLDKKKFPKIITQGTKKVPYYTNSTCLPVNKTKDVIFAIKHQEELQKLYTGGTVFHTFLGERMSSGEGAKLFIKKVFENTTIPYLTITPTFSVCPNHGYIKGEHFKCPKCKAECEVYSRVVGYLRPVQNWNLGKQAEFKDRALYDEKLALEKSF